MDGPAPKSVSESTVSRFAVVTDDDTSPVDTFVTGLREAMHEHPMWTCRLLRASAAGHLTLGDWRYVFAQYSHYSGQFTRFIAAAIANCPSDYFRSRLSENLWEEGGMRSPEERHAQLFRDFLEQGLQIDPQRVRLDPHTEHFVQQYLTHCLTGNPAFVSAFLALGTEATVARLYRIFSDGLMRVGLQGSQLRFFAIHMACDDAHAQTLVELMLSYADQPGWRLAVQQGMQRALDLRLGFFEGLFDGIRHRRLQGILEGIQTRRPAIPEAGDQPSTLPRGGHGQLIYANNVERLNVDFTVERVPFGAEVLDPRLVRIPPGRCNERHKHAHESLFFVVAGRGRVRIGDRYVPVQAGDLAFVPRWVLHQAENQGDDQMVLLAITDYGLTGKAFIGDYDRTARLVRQPAGIGGDGLIDGEERDRFDPNLAPSP